MSASGSRSQPTAPEHAKNRAHDALVSAESIAESVRDGFDAALRDDLPAALRAFGEAHKECASLTFYLVQTIDDLDRAKIAHHKKRGSR